MELIFSNLHKVKSLSNFYPLLEYEEKHSFLI